MCTSFVKPLLLLCHVLSVFCSLSDSFVCVHLDKLKFCLLDLKHLPLLTQHDVRIVASKQKGSAFKPATFSVCRLLPVTVWVFLGTLCFFFHQIPKTCRLGQMRSTGYFKLPDRYNRLETCPGCISPFTPTLLMGKHYR